MLVKTLLFLVCRSKDYGPRCNKSWCDLQGSIYVHCWQMSAVHQAAYANLPLSVLTSSHLSTSPHCLLLVFCKFLLYVSVNVHFLLKTVYVCCKFYNVLFSQLSHYYFLYIHLFYSNSVHLEFQILYFDTKPEYLSCRL